MFLGEKLALLAFQQGSLSGNNLANQGLYTSANYSVVRGGIKTLACEVGQGKIVKFLLCIHMSK